MPLFHLYLGYSGSECVWVHASFDEGLLGALFGVACQVGEDLGGDDGVTSHEVGVWYFVGQTQHTDTNTCKL